MSKNNLKLNILDFQILNNHRAINGFGHSATDMSVLFWATAVAGEVGEACNLIKKQQRGDDLPNYKEELSAELADIFIYLCLLAENQGINLEDAVIDKFNKVNIKQKVPYYNIEKRNE